MNISNGSNGANGSRDDHSLSHTSNSNGHSKNGSNNVNTNSETHEFDVRQVWGMLWRYKYTILTFTLITTCLFGFIAYNLDPVYKSEGSILISESKSYNSYRSNGVSTMLSNMYGIGRENRITDEIQILKSRSLSEKIAQELSGNPYMENGEKYPILWREYPENAESTSLDTVAQRIRKNSTFSHIEKSNLINIQYEGKSPLEAAKIVNLTMDVYIDFSSQQNRMSAHSAVQFLEEEQKRIQQNLKGAEQALRSFMNSENLVELDSQTNKLIGDIADLESNIQSIKVKLVSINSAIKEYSQRLNDLKPQLLKNYTEAILPKLDRFQYQLAELETNKMLMLSRNPNIDEEINPPAELRKINEDIARIQQKIRDTTEEFLAQNEEFSDTNLGSSGANIADNIAEIKNELIRLKVEQNQYRAQEEVLTEHLNEKRAFFEALPNNMIELARTKREVEINEQLYRTVSEQLAEMKLWEQTRFGLGRPIDAGFVPKKPEGNNQLLLLLVGVLMGGIFGIGYSCIREYTDPTISRMKQIQKFHLPVLGLIPNLKRTIQKTHGKKSKADFNGAELSTKFVTLFDSYSAESEAFRKLSNNIIYSTPQDGPEQKIVMTTSFSTDEGTSEVFANFAVSLAEMGNKVLAIDTDFRRPVLHEMLGRQRSPGILEVLTSEASLDEAIQETNIPRLDILFPGKEPSNPFFINRSNAFHKMIKGLRKRYNYILLKTAPMGLLSDATPLATLADGVMIVSRFEKTREDELEELIRNLQDINANILGVVLSSFDHKNSFDYFTGYSRSYQKAYQNYFSQKRETTTKSIADEQTLTI
ncbi:MAG: polysaccharide biosynthesis tyrosine autokinase [Gracilimonas sp.]|uniref:GumC family protein n=1 Tax=Gracilimonas sp. TaxID=1974203 RepID=UPI00198B2882|nr:polysaccharide biosynthesis tyrosine autokinase [Gracilimonas sp.]MBD3615453.1 polysaccharide biosynthesis tyrosine autokinase [Gracilimonas sp.]